MNLTTSQKPDSEVCHWHEVQQPYVAWLEQMELVGSTKLGMRTPGSTLLRVPASMCNFRYTPN